MWAVSSVHDVHWTCLAKVSNNFKGPGGQVVQSRVNSFHEH